LLRNQAALLLLDSLGPKDDILDTRRRSSLGVPGILRQVILIVDPLGTNDVWSHRNDHIALSAILPWRGNEPTQNRNHPQHRDRGPAVAIRLRADPSHDRRHPILDACGGVERSLREDGSQIGGIRSGGDDIRGLEFHLDLDIALTGDRWLRLDHQSNVAVLDIVDAGKPESTSASHSTDSTNTANPSPNASHSTRANAAAPAESPTEASTKTSTKTEGGAEPHRHAPPHFGLVLLSIKGVDLCAIQQTRVATGLKQAELCRRKPNQSPHSVHEGSERIPKDRPGS
jgi:hypothetical protein